jgi:hypothetical protein
MPTTISFFNIVIPAIGGTASLPVTDYVPEYLITSVGIVPISGDFTITPSGTPLADTVFVFKYSAQITIGSADVVIFGRHLLQNEALSVCVITCRWDGKAWVVDVSMSDNATNECKVLADANDPGAGYLDSKITGSLEIVGGGHKVQLKGDDFAPQEGESYSVVGGVQGWHKLNGIIDSGWIKVASADVLTMGSVPVSIIPGVTGQCIRPISAIMYYKWNSVVYTLGAITMLILKEVNSSMFPLCVFNAAAIADNSASVNLASLPGENATDQALLHAGQPLIFTTPGNIDPTVGNSDIYIKVLYTLEILP